MHAFGFSFDYISNYKPSILRNVTRRGKTVFAINGTATLAAAQKFYNCSTLDGVELEDEGGSGTKNSHWDRRNNYEDVIAGIVGDYMFISNITLGFFSDLGVYQPDFSLAETPLWGRALGCALLSEPCLSPQNPALGWLFCNDNITNNFTCSYDHAMRQPCYTKTAASNYPSYFQYFAGSPALGGGELLVETRAQPLLVGNALSFRLTTIVLSLEGIMEAVRGASG